jgi:hypothetical protein
MRKEAFYSYGSRFDWWKRKAKSITRWNSLFYYQFLDISRFRNTGTWINNLMSNSMIARGFVNNNLNSLEFRLEAMEKGPLKHIQYKNKIPRDFKNKIKSELTLE